MVMVLTWKSSIGSGGLSSSRFDDDVPEVNCTWTASFSWRVKEAALWFESYSSKNLTGGTTSSSQSTSTDWLTRTHHWSSPRSKLAYKKPTSTRKLRNFPVTSGQGSKHRDWTASRWWARWRSQSSSCQHHVITWRELIPADHEYLDSVAWPCHDCEVAPVWHHDVTNARACQFSTVCLTVFPFEFRPRTFTIGFYGKNSIISELMILECSFPLKVDGWPAVIFSCLADNRWKYNSKRLRAWSCCWSSWKDQNEPSSDFAWKHQVSRLLMISLFPSVCVCVFSFPLCGDVTRVQEPMKDIGGCEQIHRSLNFLSGVQFWLSPYRSLGSDGKKIIKFDRLKDTIDGSLLFIRENRKPIPFEPSLTSLPHYLSVVSLIFCRRSLFENSVEVHIHHILSGLSSVGNLYYFNVAQLQQATAMWCQSLFGFSHNWLILYILGLWTTILVGW